MITQLCLHPRLVPPCYTARHVFRWHWIHLILVLLCVLGWHSLAKRIVANLPHAPFCHAKNPLISRTWLKWYSNDKVMSHACVRLSHNSLTQSQVPVVFRDYIWFDPLCLWFPGCPWNIYHFAARRPRVRAQIVTSFFQILQISQFFGWVSHTIFSSLYVNIIAIFILSVDIFTRLFSLEVCHYRFLTKICNAFLSSYCIFLG